MPYYGVPIGARFDDLTFERIGLGVLEAGGV